MQRNDEMDSVVGKAALMYYQEWMRMKGRNAARDEETFKSSKFYTAFINFAEWARKVRLLRPSDFIRKMVNKDFSPNYWTRDEIYMLYLEELDKLPPMDQVEMSLKTLGAICENIDAEMSEVFSLMSGMDIIQLLRSRRLSPWLCLMSKRFRVAFVMLPKEQQIIIETIIRADVWAEKLENHQEEAAKIRKLVAQNGL